MVRVAYNKLSSHLLRARGYYYWSRADVTVNEATNLVKGKTKVSDLTRSLIESSSSVAIQSKAADIDIHPNLR